MFSHYKKILHSFGSLNNSVYETNFRDFSNCKTSMIKFVSPISYSALLFSEKGMCPKTYWEFLLIVYFKNIETVILEQSGKDGTGKNVINSLFVIRMLFFFPAQAEYCYFSADFRLKIFLYYS